MDNGASYSFDLVPIADGQVTVDIGASVAQDAAGNGNAAASQFGRISDTTPPAVTVDSMTSNDTTPRLTGSVDDPSAAIEVTVNLKSYAAANNGDGTWALADNTISTALTEGTYDVVVQGMDYAGNAGSDGTVNELVIAFTPNQRLEATIDILKDLVDSDPGSAMADKITDGISKLQTASDELEKMPPDYPAALGNIEGAVGELEASLDAGLLDPAEGARLMELWNPDLLFPGQLTGHCIPTRR